MYQMIRRAMAATAVFMLASVAAHAAPVTYTMDPGHTVVIATWNHFGFSHPSAMFNRVSGTVVYDAENPEQSSVEAVIPVASVHTSSEDLDKHLQAGDFFNVEEWPDVTFKSTSVKVGDEPETLEVTGDLTIRDQTHPIVLNVTINKVGVQPMSKAPAAAFNATATIKRSEFGVGLYAPMVSDEVELRITTEASAPKDEAPNEADKTAAES